MSLLMTMLSSFFRDRTSMNHSLAHSARAASGDGATPTAPASNL